jgi:hypothetical protein
MLSFPIITSYTDDALKGALCQFPHTCLISKESRQNFNGNFPKHTRYFSNGDKPLVALIKQKGYVKLTYDGQDFILNDNEVVLFDDNVPHSWVMSSCDLTNFYYRQSGIIENAVTTGNYCLDSFF